jgi:hypothetical protein
MPREATSVGVAGRRFVARSVDGARGTTSDWPVRSFDLVESVFASARSARLTCSFRAMVAIDSPFFTV